MIISFIIFTVVISAPCFILLFGAFASQDHRWQAEKDLEALARSGYKSSQLSPAKSRVDSLIC